MADIIIFPDFEKLKGEIEALRAEMSALLYEKDDLLLITCPNIEAAYYARLGTYEYNLYTLHIHIGELKRRAELIQAYINRREKPDMKRISFTIESEFAAYNEQLENELNKLNNAMDWYNSPFYLRKKRPN